MRWTPCAILFLGVALLPREAALGQSPDVEGFTIRGTIVEAGSRRPVNHALVSISSVAQRDESLSFRTGEDGRFVFIQQKAGKYTLTAHMRGFPRQTLGADEQYSTGIAVGPGVDSEHIIFPLIGGGSISGTVLDEESDPVRQAQIWLFRSGVFSGRSQLVLQDQRATNSSGQFRFPSLLPGTYFIQVQGQPWYSQTNPAGPAPRSGNSEIDVSYPLTYYAGTTEPASASALAVTEGSNSTIQITLRAVPSLSLQVSGLASKSPNSVNIQLWQQTLAGFQVPLYRGNASCSENLCEVSGMAPGRYMVSLSNNVLGRPEGSAAQILTLAASTTVDASSFRSNSLSGSIAFEGSTAPPPHASIALQRVNGRGGLRISVSGDGSLSATFGPLLAGGYQMRLVNAPGYYLKSLAAKGATVSGGEIEISEIGPIQLSLVAARGLSSLNGTALKDGKPFAGAMVLLLPRDITRLDFLRRDQSDSDGTFTLRDAPPGRYILLAIDDGRNLAYCEPDAIKRYLSGGKEITLPVPNSAAVTANVLERLQPEVQNGTSSSVMSMPRN